MRTRALLPGPPAGWARAAGVALLFVLTLAMLDGMACSAYARRTGSEEPIPGSRLFRPAGLVDGRLCIRGSACSPAVLVEGLLSTDTIGQIRQRAHQAQPASLTVCFNSPGGSYAAASKTGALPQNVRTCVADLVDNANTNPTHALCASACAWFWLGGRQRAIYGSNTVGFHAPYEYDAAACIPGNRLKGLISVARGWLEDGAQGGYDRHMLGARDALRVTSLRMGPREVYAISADRAVKLGLQTTAAPAAVFYRGSALSY